MPDLPNRTVLDEINHENRWFHAKKLKPIWTNRVTRQRRVRTLEGYETVKSGDYLCRGETGDIWPQSAESLENKYVATDELDADGWRKYVPRPDTKGVMAAKVSRRFSIHGCWGNLQGKPGDYIVKDWDDRDVVYPKDVWIVDETIFHATYQAVEQ